MEVHPYMFVHCGEVLFSVNLVKGSRSGLVPNGKRLHLASYPVQGRPEYEAKIL